MSITLEQLSAKMRQGEQVPLQQTAQIVLTLSIPSILQQIVVTAMEYIDAAMVGHIGASATASIGIVSSSTWLLHGMLAGLYMSFFPFRWHSIWVPTGRRMPGACCGSPCCSTCSSVWQRPLSASASAGICPAGWGRPGPCRRMPRPILPSGRLPALCHGHGHLLFHAAFHR